MSFEHHHHWGHSSSSASAVGGNMQQRQLEMRDSAILDRMASSKRSRGQLHSLANNQNQNRTMTPWGTDVLVSTNDNAATGANNKNNNNSEEFTSTSLNASQSRQHNQQSHQGKSHSNHPQDQLPNEDAGSYQCPDVSKTHNHFQNRETEFQARKLQMSSSKINASHFTAGVIIPENNYNKNNNRETLNDESLSKSSSMNMNMTNSNNNASNPDTIFNNYVYHQSQQRTNNTLLAAANQQPMSPPPEQRKMLSSRINDGHGIFFAPGNMPQERERPGTPRIARDFSMTSTQQQQPQHQSSLQLHDAFQQKIVRGPVKNPWNGYTDASEKFGGKVDKTGFW